MPSTVCQRSVWEETIFSSVMMAAAPTKEPNRVPMPPTIAISRPSTDCASATVEGLTKLLKKA